MGGVGVGQRRCIMGDVQVSNGKREHNKMQREKRFGFACQSPDSQIPKRTRYPFFKIIVHNLNGLFNF